MGELEVGDCTLFKAGTQYYGHNTRHGKGTVSEIHDDGSARVNFEDGGKGTYAREELELCPEAPELEVGDCTLFKAGTQYYGHNTRHGKGTISEIHDDGSARVNFEDGAKGTYAREELELC